MMIEPVDCVLPLPRIQASNSNRCVTLHGKDTYTTVLPLKDHSRAAGLGEYLVEIWICAIH